MAEPRYTVFVRVPIPRGDFVDPPPVHWDSSKDDALWRILSGAAQTEIDWNQVAETFDVPVDFLLQQVAYLTERHASQVRAQVRKATAAAKSSSAPSPVPGSEPTMSTNQRTVSALSGRRPSPLSRNEPSPSLTPINTSARPVVSRNTSTNTILAGAPSPRPTRPPTARTTEQSERRRLTSLPIASPSSKSPEPRPPTPVVREVSPGPAESNSTTSSDDESSPAQSRIIRRPPRSQKQPEATAPYHIVDEDDDESEPAFQQYTGSTKQPGSQDLGSTLRGDGSKSHTPRRSHKNSGKKAIHHSQTSDDSAGSPAMVQRPGKVGDKQASGPLSPRRAADLVGRSPSAKSKGQSQEGSDGTPSMGSSFSDLDDASVTQSALEEVLASHMNRGAGSRFSISQAFRSRYTPSSGK